VAREIEREQTDSSSQEVWYGLPNNDTIAEHNWQDPWRVEERMQKAERGRWDRVGVERDKQQRGEGVMWQPSCANGCHTKASGSREVLSLIERPRMQRRRDSGHIHEKKDTSESYLSIVILRPLQTGLFWNCVLEKNWTVNCKRMKRREIWHMGNDMEPQKMNPDVILKVNVMATR